MKRMSFSKTEQQLLDGTKTQTRRMGWKGLKAGEQVLAVRQVMGMNRGESQYPLCVIEILDVRRERLCDVTQEDVVAEGFPDWTPEQFVAFFVAFNKQCNKYTVVNVIKFKEVKRICRTS